MVLDPDSVKNQLGTLFQKVDKLEDASTESRIKVGVLEGQVQDLRDDHSDHTEATDKHGEILTKISIAGGLILAAFWGAHTLGLFENL